MSVQDIEPSHWQNVLLSIVFWVLFGGLIQLRVRFAPLCVTSKIIKISTEGFPVLGGGHANLFSEDIHEMCIVRISHHVGYGCNIVGCGG